MLKSLGLIWRWSLVIAVLFCGVCAVSPLQAEIIEVNGTYPLITLEKVDMEQAVAGGEFVLTLNVRNLSNNPGYNLHLNFKVKDGKDDKPLFPFSLSSKEKTTIDELKGKESRTIALTFAVDPEAQNKDYELVINLTGEDASFQKTVNTMTIVTVPVSYDITKPILVVKSVAINPEKPQEDEAFTVQFQIANLSKTTEARNVMLLLEGTDNFEIMDISNRKNIRKLDKGAAETVTYQLKAKDKKTANTAKLKISFDYLGSKTESVEEVINLPLPEEEADIGATPWVIVNKYTLSAERILAGNTVTLRLYVENTNKRAVKNVKISLGVIKIEESSVGGSEITKTGGTVFSPVKSSNSFYVDYIPGKTVIEKDIALYVDPNAAAKTYIVPVDIKYEDREGKTLTCEEQVNIPVTQECKLEILSVEMPPEAFIGQPIPVSAEFVNVGKVALGNFMVTMEGDFNKENTTYYVGNLDIGGSDFYQGTLIPQTEGKLEGNLVFTYIDNNNQDVRVEKPFTLEVQAQPSPQPGEGGEMGPDGPQKPGMPAPGGFWGKVKNIFKTKWLTILLSLVILTEGICIFRIKRKKANGEFFDE
jgi:hypothetical protein